MAVDMFLKVDGIPGESTDDAHAEWIELISFSHGVDQPTSGSSRTKGRTGGRADFGAFKVEKSIDTSSPDLNIFCASGQHIPTVELEMCLATGDKHTFMRYVLKDVIVSSYSIHGGSEDRATEEVEFNYGEIEWEYTPIEHDGSAGAAIGRGWSLEKNVQL